MRIKMNKYQKIIAARSIWMFIALMLVSNSYAQLPSYLPVDGLVGWWPFNGNANDESGNGNNGIVNGATLTADRNGVANAAYNFDGNDFIEISSTNGISSSSGITMSIWFKWAGPNAWSHAYFYQISPNPNGAITMNNDGTLSVNVLNCNCSSDIGISTVISQNIWYNVVLSYDLSLGLMKMYLNGNLVGTSQENIYAYYTTNNPGDRFGSYHFNEYFYSGLLDDAALYNRALTEQEIQNLYTGSNETVDTGDGPTPLPQGIPYQAAARDAQGQVIADAPVNVRFSLHEGAVDGAVSYSETHTLTTNSIGLFNTVFGNGTPEQSAFDSINWAATTKFLQVEIDLGDGYVDMGTQQMMSVPFAFQANKASAIKNAGLPVYANNAAALAGGLAAGEMYRTAAGALMVVFE